MRPDEPATAESSLPPRVQWFAPWRWFAHWQPWKRWALVAGVLLGGYILAPIPVVRVIKRFGRLRIPPPMMTTIMVVLAPLEWSDRKLPPVHWFYKSGFYIVDMVLDKWLGPVTMPTAPMPLPIPPPATPAPPVTPIPTAAP